MDIVISSSTSLTSASARSFMAGGPTGISIMVNQSAGSLVKRLVELARDQITGMLNLCSVSDVDTMTLGGLVFDLRRENDESHQEDKYQRAPRHIPRLFILLALPETQAQAHPNNDDL